MLLTQIAYVSNIGLIAVSLKMIGTLIQLLSIKFYFEEYVLSYSYEIMLSKKCHDINVI